MKIQQLLDHYQIARNPFSDEDAQTDLVFKEHCIASTYHPAWDKVYGDPSEPATAIVFGEKGAGKTALRLQICRQLDEFNRANPLARVWVIEYDDFNTFLDRFRDRLTTRLPDRVLADWQLWDHMDAILSLGVTDLIDQIINPADASEPGKSIRNTVHPDDVKRLDRNRSRDLLLLSACYDQSTREPFVERWQRLAARLDYWTVSSWWEFGVGVASSVLVVTAVVLMMVYGWWTWGAPLWLALLALVGGWVPWMWRSLASLWTANWIVANVRVGNREVMPLRQVLMHFTANELAGQPLPVHERTDDRYEMLEKFQLLLETLGYRGIIVLVDRVDEPHLINGQPDLMKAMVWPMLDNKFLKNPGIGLKLLLPIELSHFVERENREFYQRARLDKQNMVPTLAWTGEALYDVANSRLRACAIDGAAPTLREMIDPSVSDRRLIDALRSLRVPRHLFKFLYRLLVAHCNSYTDAEPNWQISSQLFESVLALYGRDQEAFDRGLGAG